VRARHAEDRIESGDGHSPHLGDPPVPFSYFVKSISLPSCSTRTPATDTLMMLSRRSAELSSWVDFCYQIMKRGVLIYANANTTFRDTALRRLRSFWNFGQLMVLETYQLQSRSQHSNRRYFHFSIDP
jgi:hypothetical protein